MKTSPRRPSSASASSTASSRSAWSWGSTVPELTEGTIVANLGYERVLHPNPVFHGDTIYVESEVLEKRPSKSRPDVGIVRLKHTGRKPDGTVVVEVERSVMFLKRSVQSTLQEA